MWMKSDVDDDPESDRAADYRNVSSEKLWGMSIAPSKV